MKRILMVIFMMLIPLVCHADWFPGKGISTVKTSDGNTVCNGVNQAIVSNGTLSCSYGIATISTGGGGGSPAGTNGQIQYNNNGSFGALPIIAGIMTNGKLCTYTSSGTSWDCNTTIPTECSLSSCSLNSSTTLNGTSILTGVTADSPLSGSGTSGSHLTLSTAGNWAGQAGTVGTINGLITQGSNITITGSGTSGSPYSIASSGAGSGTVTSITLASPQGSIKYSGTNPITSSGTVNADINWSSLQGLSTTTVNWNSDIFQHVGINWQSWVDPSAMTVNWYDLTALFNSVQTVGAAVGDLKLFDATHTNWEDFTGLTTNSGQSVNVFNPTATNTITSATTLTINTDTTGMETITALASNISINTIGNPFNNQSLVLRITDNASAHTLTLSGTNFESSNCTLPTTTNGAGTPFYWGFKYNSTASKWDDVAC